MLSRVCGLPRDLWRIVGFLSTLVGLITYAISSPFNKLFKYGELGFLVVVIYCALGSLLCCLMLCTTTWSLTKNTVVKAHAVFFVFMLSSVYSFYMDKTEANTKAKDSDKVLNLVSCGSFSLMSLSLSRLSGLGFETGVFNFFLGSLMVAVMKLNLKFALATIVFCYILINVRIHSDPDSDGGDIEEAEVALIENDGTRGPPFVPLDLRLPEVMHDVFISFRAKDTSDIPDYLACCLLKKSLRVYAHPELTGDYVSDTVIEEIGKAQVSVIVFSKSYLQSIWCLHELHNIMACRARYKRTVIPIFYNIKRNAIQSEISNNVRIKKLCNDKGVSQIYAVDWSNNLAQAASLQGWEMLEYARYELLENVANHVLSHCKPIVGLR
ncbi:hypothetical protein Fmac_005313 [Flemingia macrophylla]|uniref:ADP-ribosyl cyclase/cyclic ADP-ribose hydrolase n=1 Tax=Flemingia macrophylla TaxID=520843 RepID=A0ABD1N8S6_9FABA